MKIKKLSLTMIFLAITIIAYIAATVLFCYTTKPEITNHEFPFSITYEYKGETKTLSGIFECEYSGSNTIHGEHRRYWEGESRYINPVNPENPHIIEENEEIVENENPVIGDLVVSEDVVKGDTSNKEDVITIEVTPEQIVAFGVVGAVVIALTCIVTIILINKTSKKKVKKEEVKVENKE